MSDLIEYALGQLGGDERQRIETHLKHSQCSHCRRWVEQATRAGSKSGRKTRAPRSTPPGTAATPAAASSTWHRQALHDLEKRLHQLESER